MGTRLRLYVCVCDIKELWLYTYTCKLWCMAMLDLICTAVYILRCDNMIVLWNTICMGIGGLEVPTYCDVVGASGRALLCFCDRYSLIDIDFTFKT